MHVSGKESILNGIFRIWCVPQEPQSPLVKHRQVSGHNAVQFLGTLGKEAAANCWLSFNERCYRRHNRILSEQPRVSKTTHYLQQGWTLCLTGATQSPRQKVESMLAPLPANKIRSPFPVGPDRHARTLSENALVRKTQSPFPRSSIWSCESRRARPQSSSKSLWK